MNHKPQKRPVNGILLLDKPIGISSNAALQKARRLFRAEKAGHTGVLDPLASGLLPICFGEATKFAQYLLDADKAYTATLKFGEATTTGDAEGSIIDTARTDISAAEFQAACTAFTGQIRQVPPMFSALKHEGKPLYEYARKGIVIERKSRDITVYRIRIRSFAAPFAEIDVQCSKGTYIRTLSEDLAKHIGTFAHLTALRRTSTAGFSVEQAHTLLSHGDECKFGGGKSVRDGMAQSATATRSDGQVLDLVITNVVIIDHSGIIKADIGIRDGRIVGIGQSGNPDIMDGVTENMVIGAATEVHNGAHLIATAGGIDTHIHNICPQQIYHAIESGITTMIGGGTGPADGTNATTVTPGAWNIQRMLQAADAYPVNLGFFGKGNCASLEPLREQIAAGALGLKIHEDWGATAAVIDASLTVADEMDVQVAIHTDTLNEGGFLEDTMKAINGRVIHTFHTEGAGGGHAPDIIKAAMFENVLPASTNPTRPFTVNTIDEHLDMLMVCHHLDKRVAEDIAFADSRIRPETIAAEDILHDMGVFSIMSSDSQAMGRVAEVIIRTWQTADKMKAQRGNLPEDQNGNDNFRIKRYLAKYTINPAIAHGISDHVGSLEVGKMADIVLWKPAFFGVKPEIIIKNGFISYARMGDPNASIPTPQPVIYRPMFGAQGGAVAQTAVLFVSQAAQEADIRSRYGLSKQTIAVKNCRHIGKKDLIHNNATPDISVDPERYEVRVDGKIIGCEPAHTLPLAQRYFLF